MNTPDFGIGQVILPEATSIALLKALAKITDKADIPSERNPLNLHFWLNA